LLLEEYAVADLLDFLGLLSFNALAVQENRSFMKNCLGKKVMSDAVTCGTMDWLSITLPCRSILKVCLGSPSRLWRMDCPRRSL